MSKLQDPKKGAGLPELTPHDMELARVAHRCIAESLDRARAARIQLVSEEGDLPEALELPPQALRLIGELLGGMSQGKIVTLLPAKREMTTIEAANFLHVSRPFVVKEMEAGNLPFRKVGTHRRVEFEALVEYKDSMRSKQEEALQRAADIANELGLDY